MTDQPNTRTHKTQEEAEAEHVQRITAAVRNRADGHVAPGLFAYFTNGGTQIFASPSRWNDDDQPRDLLAVIRTFSGISVIAVWPLVPPHLVDAVNAALNTDPQETPDA